MFDSDGLRAQITSGKRLVIFLHDNPDPDAIAAGWLLSRVAESVGRKAVIVYGGRLGRAENRTMVKLLKIPLRHLDTTRLRQLKSDRYAVVDTQPGTGNNSFPHDRLTCNIIIDHHPPRPGLTAHFVDIRSDHGCSTTTMLDYWTVCGLELDPDLATAVAYAIASETQDLKREATRADRAAFQLAFASARLTVLGRIRYPNRTREYYRTIARAMGKVMLSRNTSVCHIGPVDEAEVVAEVADFLARMERVTWCLVSGLHEGQMVLSIRSTQPNAKAEQVIRKALGRQGKGGGHGMIAGGLMPIARPEEYVLQAERLTERFLSLLNRRQSVHLRPLLADPE